MRYEDFKTQEEHLDLNGNPIKVETRGGIKANGARVSSGDVTTENGTVIGLDDLLFNPSDRFVSRIGHTSFGIAPC